MRMTRRRAVQMLAGAGVAQQAGFSAASSSVRVPVHRIVDSRAHCTSEQLHYFWWTIWPEAVVDFSRCGVEFLVTDGDGEIRRSPGGFPVFTGLQRGAVNVVVTKVIPLSWTRGRGIAGVTTIW